MALFYRVYVCPRCSYLIEDTIDGSLIYENKEYLNLQCRHCKKVEIINVSQEQAQNRNSQLSSCCHEKMQPWEMDCPSCGHHMVTQILSDD